MKFKKLWIGLLVLLTGWSVLSVQAQEQTKADICPDAGKVSSPKGRGTAMGRAATLKPELLYSFNIRAGNCAMESDGKYFYTTAWSVANTDLPAGTFLLYDGTGREVTQVVVKDGGFVRDLTTDGRYFYGGQFDGSGKRDILKMDIKTGTLIERIPVKMASQLAEVRHCTYDPGLDGGRGGFWIGGWDEMAAVSMTGQELIPNISNVTETCYGVAIDRITDPANPRLLMFQQVGSMVEIHGFDIITRKATGLVLDMKPYLPGSTEKSSAGGFTSYEEGGSLILLGCVQQSPNWVFAMKIATVNDNIPGMATDLTVTDKGNGNAELRWTNPAVTRGGKELTGTLKLVVRRNGAVVYTLNDAKAGAPVKWMESGISGKSFTYSVHAVNGAGVGEPIYVTGYKAVTVWGTEGWYDKTWYAANTGSKDAVITTSAQMAAFAKRVNEGRSFSGCTVRLAPASGSEISLAGAEWVPAGKAGTGFAGTFDGQGNRIVGLTISKEVDYPYVGLFGKLTGTVRNLSVAGDINAITESGRTVQAGAIAGYCSGMIEMCASRTGVKVMGLGNVINNTEIGGVVGRLEGGTIRYCSAIGNVEVNGEPVYAGGLAGHTCGTAPELMYTYFVGRITSSQSRGRGGIVGNRETGTVKRNYYNQELFTAGGIGTATELPKDVTEQAEGKTAVYMKASLTEDLNYARWVWAKDMTGVNDGYPLLNWQDVTIPRITAMAATNVTVTGATLNANLKEGTMPLTGKGFEYKEAGAADYVRIVATVSGGNMSKTVSGLTKGKKYVFRAYATTSVEGQTRYNYGEELLFVTAGQLASGIRCVKPVASGKGDGTSWADASADLQKMINTSGVTEIWMAAGSYRPDSKDRGVSFKIPENKKVYGGFEGTESARNERNLYINRTVLNGDIGIPNDNTDNTYHVVQMSGGLLDGVTVSGGNANASFSPGWDGGGVYMSGSSELRNSIVSNNQGGVGGGVYMNSMAKIYNCLITNNKSVRDGGSVLGAGVHFEGGEAWYCTIVGNMGKGNYGGVSQKGGKMTGCVVWNNYPGQIGQWGYGSWNMTYSAVQGLAASGTNISLGSGNTDGNGPHFNDPSVNNYYFGAESPLGGAGEPVGTAGRQTSDIFGVAYPAAGNLPIGAFSGDGSQLDRQVAVVTVVSREYAYEEGKPKNVTVTTQPAGLRCEVTYRDRSGMIVGAPEEVGTYDVTAVVTQEGYVGQGNGTLKIVEAEVKQQQITWNQSNTELEVGLLAVKLEAATDASGLKVAYYSENPNVIRVEQRGEDWYAFAQVTAGTVNICAYQNGNREYAAAKSVVKNFTAIEMTNPVLAVPDVTTRSVDPLTGTQATLRGLVVPGALPVSDCGFEWRKSGDAAYASVTATPGDDAISRELTGLTAGNVYEYRVFASVVRDGKKQTVYGNTVEFTTPVLPTVTVTSAGGGAGGVYNIWSDAVKAINDGSLTGEITMTIDGEITADGPTPSKAVVVTGGVLKLASPKLLAGGAVTFRNIEFAGSENVAFYACGNELTMDKGVVFPLRSAFSIYGGKDTKDPVAEGRITVKSGHWTRLVAGGAEAEAVAGKAAIRLVGGNIGEVDVTAAQSSELTIGGSPLVQTLLGVQVLVLDEDLGLAGNLSFAPGSGNSVKIRKNKILMVDGTLTGNAKVTVVYDAGTPALLTKADNGVVVVVSSSADKNAFLLTNESKQLKKNDDTGEYTIEEVTAVPVMQLRTAEKGQLTFQMAANAANIPATVDNSRTPQMITLGTGDENYNVDMSGAGDDLIKLVTFAENADKVKRIAATASGATVLDVKNAAGLEELEIGQGDLRTLILPDVKDKLSKLVLDGCGLTALDVSAYSALTNLSVQNNRFTFKTLPEKKAGWGTFVYAPQDTVIPLPVRVEKDENVGLGGMERTVGGNHTVYVWKTKVTGKTLTAGTDYTVSDGVFRFQPTADSIWCEITHPSWPDLTLRTTCMFVADPSKEDQHIVFDLPTTVSLGEALLPLNALASSGLSVSYTGTDDDVANVDGSILVLNKVGNVRIIASQAGNEGVNAAPAVSRPLEITAIVKDSGKQDQTITFGTLGTVKQSAGTLPLTATSSAGLAVRYISSDESVAAVAGNSLILHKAGKVTVAATQEGNAEVNAADPVLQVLMVEAPVTGGGKQDQTILFSELGRMSLSIGISELTAISTVGLSVAFISSNPDIASVQGSLLVLHKTGKVQITAIQAGDGDVNPAPAVSRSLEVVMPSNTGKEDQTLTFAELGTVNRAVGVLPLTATSSKGLEVVYFSNNDRVAQVIGGQLILRGAGQALIGATQEGNDEVNAAIPVIRQLTVEEVASDPGKTDQTITFNLQATVKQEIAILGLTGTSSANLALKYWSSDESVAEVVENNLILHGAGTVEVIATQMGSPAVNAAAPVFRTLKVEIDSDPDKLDQRIQFTLKPSYRISDGRVLLQATAASGLPVELTSDDAAVASISGSTLSLLKEGTVWITARQSGNETWNPAPVIRRLLTIESAGEQPGKKEQTISFELIPDVNLAQGKVSLRAVSTSGLPVVYTSDNAAVASVSGSVLTLLKSGTVNIAAMQEGDGTWKPATTVVQPLTIAADTTILPGKKSQTITFTLPASVKQGAVSLTLTGSSSSGLPVSYSSSNPEVVSVEGNTLLFLRPGIVVITASQAGNKEWNPAGAVSHLMTVVADEAIPGKQDQSITFDLSASEIRKVGTTLELTAAATSNLPVRYVNSNPEVATLTGGKLSFKKTGTLLITAMQAGDEHWNAAEAVTRTLLVDKNDQTITFAPASPVKLSDKSVALAATATSGLAVTFTSSDTTIASVSGKTLTLHKAGSVTLTASQVGNDSYNPATATAVLAVGKGDQVISFTLPASVGLQSGSLALTATSTSGLAVTFTSSDTTVASVSGTTLTLHKGGKVTITALQTGDDNWNAAQGVSHELSVGKKVQTITFTLASPVSVGVGSVELVATSTSGLAVTFVSSDPTVASVSGTTLTLHKGGNVTITALQAGDDSWNAAQEVSHQLSVDKKVQTITFTLASPVTVGVGSVELAAAATSGFAVSFTSSDPEIASVSGTTLTLHKAGSVTITASQAGDSIWTAAVAVTQTLQVKDGEQTITFVLASPVRAGVGSVELAATATSGLAVTFTSSDPEIASVSGTTLQLHQIGSVTITASQAGNNSWDAAPDVTQILVIEKGPGITPPDPDKGSVNVKDENGKEYGKDDIIPDGTVVVIVPEPEEGYEFVEWNDGNTDNPRRVTMPVDENLSPVFKKTQQIDFTLLPASVRQSVMTLTLEAVATSGLDVQFRSSDESVATVSGKILTLHAAGAVTITASQAGDDTWGKAREQQQTLTVDDSYVVLAPDAEQGTVEIRDDNGTAYETGTVIPDGTKITVTAVPAEGWAFAGWSNKEVGNPLVLTLPLSEDLSAKFKHLQVIDFVLPEYFTLGDAEAVDLNATAESGLPVVYESSDPKLARVENGRLLILGQGQVAVTARQAGDDMWMPAEDVVRTIVILPRVPEMDVVNVVDVRGDNNTRFLIKNFELYRDITLKLMNIQGKIIYRTDHYDNSFDMRDLPRGAYYYVIEGVMHNGNRETVKGGIEVIRN